MPDVREVYEMVTAQRPADTGALERQRTRQIRTARNRKVGAFVVAAAIGVAAIVSIFAIREAQDATERTTGSDVEPTPMEVATRFVAAYAAHDLDRTMSYLAEDADLVPMLGWIGSSVDEPAEGFRLLFGLLEAEDYEHILGSCEVVGGSASVASMRCPYDFHALGSEQLGRGPFAGSYFELIVRDGEIVRVGSYMEAERFGPLMWAPFARWVSRNHPDDVAVMYTDESQTLERVTDESIRLWERHVRAFVAQPPP